MMFKRNGEVAYFFTETMAIRVPTSQKVPKSPTGGQEIEISAQRILMEAFFFPAPPLELTQNSRCIRLSPRHFKA